MSDTALRMEHVYKKFLRGETFNSLRDLIPALTGRMFRQRELGPPDKREFWALQDISLEVNKGEAFGIIGHNGAGKSTMLKILSRIMRPTSGSMVVNGRLSALIEVSAGFHQDLTGRENIFLNGSILGMGKREIASKLDQIIAFSGLEDFIDTPVKRYSSGMYARLGFSVAAHVDPDVMIVDEVLSVGDFAFQQRCIARMREVISNGATVLFVSHNLKAVTEFCTRGLLLDHGKVVVQGGINEVVQRYLTDSQGARKVDKDQDVVITSIRVRGRTGEANKFESGETVWVDVSVSARKACEKLSVSISLTDATGFIVFNTSTERLGLGAFHLKEGESYHCSFELKLNLTGGAFDVTAYVFRYDIEKTYDSWMRAVTLFVSCDLDVRGVTNCFPTAVGRISSEAMPALAGAATSSTNKSSQ